MDMRKALHDLAAAAEAALAEYRRMRPRIMFDRGVFDRLEAAATEARIRAYHCTDAKAGAQPGNPHGAEGTRAARARRKRHEGLDRLTLRQAKGREVRRLRELENRNGQLFPAGTLFQITGKFAGWEVTRVSACAKCGSGQRQWLARVAGHDLELVEDP